MFAALTKSPQIWFLTDIKNFLRISRWQQIWSLVKTLSLCPPVVDRGHRFAWPTLVRITSFITSALKWIKVKCCILDPHGGAAGGKGMESSEAIPHERSFSFVESTVEGRYEMPVSSCHLLFAFWLIVQAFLVCQILPWYHAVLVKCQSHEHLILNWSPN